MLLNRISRQKLFHHLRHVCTAATNTTPSPSLLRSKYSFTPPSSLSRPNPNSNNPNPYPTRKKTKKPRYRPPSSLITTTDPENNNKRYPLKSNLPFDFRFSYTESNPNSRPIGLREPRYSPFGPGRFDRKWTGICAPFRTPKVTSVDGDDDDVEIRLDKEDPKLVKRRTTIREIVQGKALTEAEMTVLLDGCLRGKTKRQINLGRDGLTHNMLNDIHNHWKHAEAVRIKCMGVPTIDMENVCTQLEDKTYGKIIQRHGGLVVLYRGRNYRPKKRPVIPLMLWKPSEPIYPRLIKTTIEGLSIEETKEIRKRGLAVPAMIKLGRNGYYGNLVPMVRDAFLEQELVRIDCTGLDKSDHRKISVKLRDLVPCILVTFMKEQIVIWRGKEYEAPIFLTERELKSKQTKLVCEAREETRAHDEITVDNLVWD